LSISLDSLPALNLTTAALLILGLCVGFVLLRGIWQMLLGVLVFGASVWLAFWIWQLAPAWSILLLGKPIDTITLGLPIIAFLVGLFVFRMLVHIITRPFVRSRDDAPARAGNFPMRLFFALMATAVLWLIGAKIVHHAGSIAEIRGSVEKSANAGLVSAFLQRMKSSIEAALPRQWLEMLDPLAEPGRLALAKLIAIQSAPVYPPVIDPKTGKPYPRAIIVDDPALQRLVHQRDYSTLLRHPKLTQALNDPKVKQAIKDNR